MAAAPRSTRVAVWGCGHGELDRVYKAVDALNAAAPDRPIELLICAGDFQAVRNEADLATMACPPKYRRMNTFFRYYSGSCAAPVLTLFVGGNHEASNYLQELAHGGWVAPNIYYLGRSGVVQFRGLRIAGVSGIFKDRDFATGYHEQLPYDDSAERSINHCREFDYAKLSMLQRPVDVVVGHDWPRGIEHYGDTAALLRAKPLFESDIRCGQLGNPASWQLLTHLRPRFWFGAHLHNKFAALVIHPPRLTVNDAASGSVSSKSESAAPFALAAPGQTSPALAAQLLVPASSSATGSVAVIATANASGSMTADITGSGNGPGGAVKAEAHSPSPSPGPAPLTVPLAVPVPVSHWHEPATGTGSATGNHAGATGTGSDTTRFLALDKCLPGRAYLQVMDIPWRKEVYTSDASEAQQLCYDPEWLAILQATYHVTPTGRRYGALPPMRPPSQAAIAAVCAAVAAANSGAHTLVKGGTASDCVTRDAMCELPVPLTFELTAPVYEPPYPGAEFQQPRNAAQPTSLPDNPQTRALLSVLGLSTHPRAQPETAHIAQRFIPSQVARSLLPPLSASAASEPALRDPAEIDLE